MFKAEYIWLDGSSTGQELRSKTKIIRNDIIGHDLPEWSFDGSSTNQAEGSYSDCILKPVRLYTDPFESDISTGVPSGHILALCEVYNPDGTPHSTNYRHNIEDEEDLWIGFEQEYTIMSGGVPWGFQTDNGTPRPQGPYYCGVGHRQVSARDFVNHHLELCLQAGIGITGINAEVMLGQWEFQVFNKGAKKTSDDLWMARYLLHRLSERYGFDISLHPKPMKGDWNGSGMHTNFSNGIMRGGFDPEYFDKIYSVFEKNHTDHLTAYGEYNDLRLTGKHETASMHSFTWGVAHRGASIRVPLETSNTGKGYLEDRRPASNANPYLVVDKIMKSLKEIS